MDIGASCSQDKNKLPVVHEQAIAMVSPAIRTGRRAVTMLTTTLELEGVLRSPLRRRCDAAPGHWSGRSGSFTIGPSSVPSLALLYLFRRIDSKIRKLITRQGTTLDIELLPLPPFLRRGSSSLVDFGGGPS